MTLKSRLPSAGQASSVLRDEPAPAMGWCIPIGCHFAAHSISTSASRDVHSKKKTEKRKKTKETQIQFYFRVQNCFTRPKPKVRLSRPTRCAIRTGKRRLHAMQQTESSMTGECAAAALSLARPRARRVARQQPPHAAINQRRKETLSRLTHTLAFTMPQPFICLSKGLFDFTPGSQIHYGH